MCQGDGKMRWQIGGNVEPVKMICELNWHECPGAILNYIWSEIVTDVVECLSSETMLWRVLATIVVCTLVAHTVYYKIRWLDETSINRENLNRVSFKVQDLELKVNILTYKMQYGAWPLPRDIQSTEFEENELHKLKLTLSNSKQRNGWIKHLLLSPKQNGQSLLPHSRSSSRSVECLARLIDLEAKYMPSQFYHNVSPGGSNMARTSWSAIMSEKSTRYTKVGNVGSRYKLSSYRDASKSENAMLQDQDFEETKLITTKWPTSGDVSNEIYTNNLQAVSRGKSKKPFEKLIRVADECQKFMEDIKCNNKSFTLMDSLSSESKNENHPIGRTTKMREKEPVDTNRKKTNERERGGGSRAEEKQKHEESFENYSNASNEVTPITSHEKVKTCSTSAVRISKSDVEHNLENTIEKKKTKLLPENLSITFKMMPDSKPLWETKTKTAVDIEKSVKNEISQSTREPSNTNAILHSVKDKLENLHKVLRSYDAQNDSTEALESKVKTLKVIRKVNELMESEVTEDLCNTQRNEKVNKIFSTNADRFCTKDEMSSGNEKCDTNETTRSSNSSVHSGCRLNIFNIDEKTGNEKSPKMENNISNEDWTHETAETTKIKNTDKDGENNENKVIESDTAVNESENKIRNFYCLTSISNNTSSISSRESVGSSPRNDVSVPQILSECGNRNEYQNQVDSSSNIEDEIIPKNKMALRNKEEVNSMIKMETEEDTAAISQTSSQTEISNSSDLELESKSTVQLLQEALVFKKVLLSHMELESCAEKSKEEKQINNEENNNPSGCDDLPWNKNENHFHSKLLDIISEEQSASSSTEKTGKNSHKNGTKNRFQKDSNTFETYSNNDDRCKKSKDALATTSSEYFSLTNMQYSEKNLEKFAQNDDSMFRSKIELESKVTTEKINNTKEAESSLKKTTCAINSLVVRTLSNIQNESESQNNNVIFNKNGVSDKVQRVEKKNLLEHNFNQLDLQNVQQAQYHNKMFLQNQDKTTEATHEATRQREEDKNLNIVQTPLERTSWNPMAESSSDEGVKKFFKTIPDNKSESLDISNADGTTISECPKSNIHNFSRKSNNLSLKRQPRTFSFVESKTLKHDENLVSFDNDEKSIDTLQQNISTTKNNSDSNYSIQSYSVNEVLDENAMNTVTLDKWNVNDKNSLVAIDAQENSSPLTGRTVVLPMNNMFIDDWEETMKRPIEITPEINVVHDLIVLESTPPEFDNVKNEMGIVINEPNKYIDYTALELSINVDVDSNKREEQTLRSTQPTVNQEQILKNSISNITSQPSSLYFTDEASLSEIKLNSMCLLNLDIAPAQSIQTESKKTNDNMPNIENQTIAVNKSRCIISKLPNVERLDVSPVADTQNTDSATYENNKILQELDTEISSNTSTLARNNDYGEHKTLDLNVKMNTVVTNKSNTDTTPQTAHVDNRNANGHTCAAEKDDNTEKLVLQSLISAANLNSDTSNSFVSASNQDFVKSNNINIALDRPILNCPLNKGEISSVNKSTRCSSASQLSRLPWSTRTTPLSSASSLKSKKLEKPAIAKADVNQNRQKMKCKSMDLKGARNDGEQLSAKSHLSLKYSGQPSKYLSSQSGTEIPQRRSRSSVTPRKSQISPRDDNFDNLDNRGNQTSRSRDYTPRLAKKNLQGNVTTSKSQSRTTTKTISKSCIPILKSRLETEKKLESEMRSKSPARGPMTITSSQIDGAPCTLTQYEIASDLLEGGIRQSRCLTEKEIEDQNESGDIINVLELQDISEQYADPKPIDIPNNSSVRDSDRSIIYMNIETDQDHSDTGVIDPKRFIKCVQDNELKVQNVDKDKVDRDYESKKPTSVNRDEHVSPILTAMSTITNDNLLDDEEGMKSSKIVTTDETKDSCCIGIEHKEIEVSVKPSVTDTSTSISDLPDVSRGSRCLMEEFKIFEVPKELTKEEYIVLLETLNQDPNLLQFRRMQKLCSKLGLGFRE